MPSDHFRPSRMYNYVRSRQLEGTFPGPAETGNWPITTLRVHKGWGSPPEEAWPYDGDHWPPAPEPPGIDVLAKENRLFAYERLRTIDECRQLLAAGSPFFAGLEIDESWASAPGGWIADSGTSASAGSHSVYFVGYDDPAERLLFVNSWGAAWGDHGRGSLSYAYFDEHLLEAWEMDTVWPAWQRQGRKTGTVVRVRGVHDALGRVMHLAEAADAGADETLGWALAVEIGGILHVDDLFVRPSYRRQGWGHELAAEVRDIAARRRLPCTLWFAHADWTGAPTPAQAAILRVLGLTVAPCTERWAAAVATPARQN